MVTAVLPANNGSRISKRRIRRWLQKVRLAGKTAFTRLGNGAKPVLANLVSIPLTVAGFACLDGATWMWHPIAGLAAAGVLLIVLEMLISDEA